MMELWLIGSVTFNVVLFLLSLKIHFDWNFELSRANGLSTRVSLLTGEIQELEDKVDSWIREAQHAQERETQLEREFDMASDRGALFIKNLRRLIADFPESNNDGTTKPKNHGTSV